MTVVLLCGIPSETPLARVREELDSLGEPSVLYNQRQFDDCALDLVLEGRDVDGRLTIHGATHTLDDISGVYLRLMDDSYLPEHRGEPPDSPSRTRSRTLSGLIERWCEVTDARVVNRLGAMASNASKPYQLQWIRRLGFDIPETLITTDPELALTFCRDIGQVIFKSMSGVRSIVRLFGDEDARRIDRIRWCPTQFQEFVPGTNVRVHTIGGECFATEIETTAVDYRYASHESTGLPTLRAIRLDADLQSRCLALAGALELSFAGIDLKIRPDGGVVCFEVNPSPAFSYFEAHTQQPIAASVARFLCGG